MAKQTPEHRLMNQIRLYCGQQNWLAFRYNTGTIVSASGEVIHFGPPKGHSDIIVYTNQGQAIFVETKTHPRKASKEQVEFLNEMTSRGFLSFVCYSLDEFIQFTLGLHS